MMLDVVYAGIGRHFLYLGYFVMRMGNVAVGVFRRLYGDVEAPMDHRYSLN